MNITYTDSKEVTAYKDFVCSPTNRDSQRNFRKYFPASIEKQAVKLHQRLAVMFNNAADYNRVFGNTDNRIERKDGQRDSDNIVFKTRINDSYRKFFNVVENIADFSLLKVCNWQGNFEIITDIHVIDVNKHDYKGV
ncbi:MAG: hypothetical protein J6W06_02525 [Bacteroidales bacterium]|jgi:hypothetical protein|nr:hypothetical protein [Bacteroidales bacterium]